MDGYPNGIGSGVAVIIDGKKAILTAEHVSFAVFPIGVTFCSYFNNDCVGSESNFIVDISRDIGNDWAIYYVDEFPEGVKPATISLREQSVGNDVWLMGMGWGTDPLVVSGKISWIDEMEDGKLLKLDAYCVPGFSGGGVFDSKGRLIGIAVAIRVSNMGPQENYVLAVPITNIKIIN